ncbi:bifunctional phosphopantothenoylcysteine decarboxylase/phosphopantothenate--cysteine ligase CoaBC [Methylocystis heyeri]|uniref:Coenzyme A biosynthesis bifunctional protein CoaBC n=1 Tax=Methylocystis heyeri TaxID=391905 RepID=A0A6B8KMQ3_9HYPH|nr:bifunctional phosphopantothenoylcysteine decarboxylase/phosphopantothenate--cysteine ligase CoaBC [Methylocystis heyeri]
MAQNLAGKRVLLVVGGGVAAYKCLELVRRLAERGAAVRVVMTEAARRFVTDLSFAAVSGKPVAHDLFDAAAEGEMGHIRLSREADLLVVAPATANLLARAANGIANDLATTLLLATDKRVLFAPAMNLRMWLHPATQRNVALLRSDGALFVGPEEGDMACGERGPGRMSEPADIIAAIEAALAQDMFLRPPLSQGAEGLAGRHVVVTSGPTHEPIDPVRFIANRSSGKQGHAIAAAAARAGARVTLISGPVTLEDPPGVDVRRIETAQEMLAAVKSALPADVFVAAAAVADWRVEAAAQKIKKSGAPPSLTLVENPDILATVAAPGQDRPGIVVGFAAETGDTVRRAQEKFLRKGCDLLVANDVSSGVFGADENTVHIVTASGVEDWPRLGKEEVAERLAGRLARMLADRNSETSA